MGKVIIYPQHYYAVFSTRVSAVLHATRNCIINLKFTYACHLMLFTDTFKRCPCL